MPLKTLVKVGNITNLSDARYCAGMGVDFLGFSVIHNQPSFIPAKTYQEIRGWVSGPRIVAEFYGYDSTVSVDEIISGYAPDLIECTFEEFKLLRSKVQLPFHVKVTATELSDINADQIVEHWMIDEADLLKANKTSLPLLVVLKNNDRLQEIIDSTNVKGVILSGSSEIRPGFKEYDMADILEALESD